MMSGKRLLAVLGACPVYSCTFGFRHVILFIACAATKTFQVSASHFLPSRGLSIMKAVQSDGNHQDVVPGVSSADSERISWEYESQGSPATSFPTSTGTISNLTGPSQLYDRLALQTERK